MQFVVKINNNYLDSNVHVEVSPSVEVVLIDHGATVKSISPDREFNRFKQC